MSTSAIFIVFKLHIGNPWRHHQSPGQLHIIGKLFVVLVYGFDQTLKPAVIKLGPYIQVLAIVPFGNKVHIVVYMTAGVKREQVVERFFQHTLLAGHVGVDKPFFDLLTLAQKSIIKSLKKGLITYLLAQDTLVASIENIFKVHFIAPAAPKYCAEGDDIAFFPYLTCRAS